MIKSLDETIKQLILTKGEFDPTEIEVRFDKPTRDWAAGLTRPAINCYLYDIRENRDLRSREWIIDRQPNGQVSKKIAPLRVDLSYLLTAWTNEVGDEHTILWRVLVALSSAAVLPADLLQGELRHQPFPLVTQTAQSPEFMQNLSDLWNVMENELKPAINYVVTLAVERDYAFSGPVVFTKRIAIAQAHPNARPETLIQIGGVVYEQTTHQPIADAQVWLIERGQGVRTDSFGRYTLSSLSPGSYTLRVVAGERTADHPITIPSGRADLTMYDLPI